MQNSPHQPQGELSLRTVAMPADTNPHGDIFGGWIMSLMDLGAGVAAGTRAKGRVATAAVSNLSFLQPVKVGDVVCVYTDVIRTGRSSITVGVEAESGSTEGEPLSLIVSRGYSRRIALLRDSSLREAALCAEAKPG